MDTRTRGGGTGPSKSVTGWLKTVPKAESHAELEEDAASVGSEGGCGGSDGEAVAYCVECCRRRKNVNEVAMVGACLGRELL